MVFGFDIIERQKQAKPDFLFALFSFLFLFLLSDQFICTTSKKHIFVDDVNALDDDTSPFSLAINHMLSPISRYDQFIFLSSFIRRWRWLLLLLSSRACDTSIIVDWFNPDHRLDNDVGGKRMRRKTSPCTSAVSIILFFYSDDIIWSSTLPMTSRTRTRTR